LKIYTKTGDEGETSLFAGGRVSKDDARLHAYGTIDELNSILGMARAHGLDAELDQQLDHIQSLLFEVGADLATPLDADAKWIVRVDTAMVEQLESEIDVFESELAPLKNFILPNGTSAAATLHFARTVCRRAERWMVSLSRDVEINPVVRQYVNRLSDWLFVAARIANHRANVEDVIWQSPRQKK
jgi:cob(I)alamin adenosyltransferase